MVTTFNGENTKTLGGMENVGVADVFVKIFFTLYRSM